MTRFEDFVHSPYHSKHRDVRSLVAYLSQIYPDFSERKCNREVVFQKIFPGKQHHQPQLAVVFSYCMRLVEQFLICEALFEEGKFDDRSMLIKQLRRRNLFSLIKISFKEKAEGVSSISAKHSKSPQKNGGSEARLRLAAEADAVAMQLSKPSTANLVEKQRLLDAHYFSETLRDACELLQRTRLLKSDYTEPPLLQAVQDILPNLPKENQPELAVAEIYAKLYKLLKNNDLQAYPSTLQAIREAEPNFRREEAQALYNYLQNFCIEQINRGNADFLSALFKLYQLQLDSGLLLAEGRLPEWHYKNIVTTGLRLDERNWVREFLDKYRPLLPPAVAENAYSYNLAAWNYHVGRLGEVLPLLVSIEYTDLRYNLDAKALLLRTFFDLDEEAALLAHAQAFEQFVKRQKTLTEFQKKGYRNLIRFAKMAYRLRWQRGMVSKQRWQASFRKLEEGLGSGEPIFNLPWLEGKVASLKP